MKKPLIVLVDDDPALLEALEAELTPRFREIARVEAFESASALLERLPEWEVEQRSIAVAIVDQKMPDITGVELLCALRAAVAAAPGEAFHPARHMRAVLLTGYAGLDSALTAKNEAGVDRYREKPWEIGRLAEDIEFTFARSVADGGLGRYWEFRELTEVEELRRALEIRHHVYAATSDLLRSVIPTGASLDIENFDTVSREFGLLEYGTWVAGTPIGTLRVAGDEPAPALDQIRAAIGAKPELLARLEAPVLQELPLLKYLIDREAVERILERMRLRHERVVEPGRLALLPDYRAGGQSSPRHLARHIIEGAIGYFFHFEIPHAILTCVPLHTAFYRPFGFAQAEGTEVRFHSEMNADIACLHGSIPRVPSPARERCESLAARIAVKGGACRCASFPDCLGGPYERGEFGEVDIFCPARARELVGPPLG